MGRADRGGQGLRLSERPLVVLGAGAGQLGALRAARRLAVPVIACDADPRALAVRLGVVERVEPVSTMDAAGVEALCRRVGAGGLLAPGTDRPVRVAAAVAARLGIAHPLDPAAAARLTDKPAQRAAFAAAGVPQPRFALDAVDGLRLPVVVKAADGQGQRGLSIVHRPQDVPGALAAARAAAPGGAALAEELVEGPELTVNAFHLAGRLVPLTVTDRERAGPPGVATAHLWPAERGTHDVVVVAEAACAALGLRDGPSYTQVVLGPQGPRVVEVAARLGGGHDAELCHAALGVDLAALAVRAARGEAVADDDLRPRRRLAGVARFLVAPEGEIVAVDGEDDARRLPGIEDVLVYREPGDRQGPLRVGADRAGYVLAVAADRPEAERRAVAALAAIQVHVRG